MKTTRNSWLKESINNIIVTGLILLCSNYSKSQTNPCLTQIPINCGENANYSLFSGGGVWNPTGPWGTPGHEQVFTFVPQVTSNYNILVTNNNFYVDLFYKVGSCSSTGWTYVDDILSSANNVLTLTAGVTYYFLIDDENTTASSGFINISCPCIPPLGGIDETISINTNLVNSSSTTLGACNDCAYRSSSDRVIGFEITCAGDYTFSLCGGATWDTYLYLSDQPCAGNVLAFNDDNCGLQSSITANLNAGTVYLAIEGWSNSSAGDYEVEVSTLCNFSPLPVELIYFTGESIDRKNYLYWQTASELNNDFFILERSVDGVDFSQIAIIPGHGTTQEINNYFYEDASFPAVTNYYRLRQVDFNGHTELHDIIALDFQTNFDNGLSIFPNPNRGVFTVSIDKHLVSSFVTVQNDLGQNILIKNFPANDQITIDMNERPGIYFVMVNSESQILTRKIIIQ